LNPGNRGRGGGGGGVVIVVFRYMEEVGNSNSIHARTIKEKNRPEDHLWEGEGKKKRKGLLVRCYGQRKLIGGLNTISDPSNHTLTKKEGMIFARNIGGRGGGKKEKEGVRSPNYLSDEERGGKISM